MRWLALACGLFVLVAWLALRQAPSGTDAQLAQPAPVPVPANTPAAPAPAMPAPSPVVAASKPPMALRGLVYLPVGSGTSQALLAVEGRPAQAFHEGDMLAGDWKLQSIRKDHVIVASPQGTSRLDIDTSSAPAAVAAAPTNAREDKPLPGFVKGGDTVTPATVSRETNRRFLEDRRKRAASAAR